MYHFYTRIHAVYFTYFMSFNPANKTRIRNCVTGIWKGIVFKKRKERKERKEERKAVEERGRPGKKELYSVIIKTAPALNKTHINL